MREPTPESTLRSVALRRAREAPRPRARRHDPPLAAAA